jgi:pilus assembly protein Flp/PilA
MDLNEIDRLAIPRVRRPPDPRAFSALDRDRPDRSGACLGLSAPRSVLLARCSGRIVRATFHGKEVNKVDLISLLRDDDGQGLVEYALIIAVIAIAVIVAMIFLKGQIQNIFSNIGNNLT